MTGKWHGGKGSDPRKVDPAKFASNWDRIFNKKEEEDGRRKGPETRRV